LLGEGVSQGGWEGGEEVELPPVMKMMVWSVEGIVMVLLGWLEIVGAVLMLCLLAQQHSFFISPPSAMPVPTLHVLVSPSYSFVRSALLFLHNPHSPA